MHPPLEEPDGAVPLTGAASGAPALILRAEGLAVFAAALVAYAAIGASWWLFAALILAPDLSMLGYLAGPKSGAHLYNAVHSYVGPLAMGIAAHALGAPLAGTLALIWLAHIGLDRALGYGLKYTAGFALTHLGRLGRK
ncbi:DUF4260 domain-containing protein [Ancylobacter sp.]|uniref:DUF4260 domain-containing protein n=1 Tax=Ancylobacter sp. TaxID=1872567 RepID=UPI003D110D45